MSELSLGLTASASPVSRLAVRRYFFDVSLLKLVVMTLVTFGLYEVYWFYKNWQMAKERGEDVMPLARAIFSIFFVHSLFKEVEETGRAASLPMRGQAGTLALLFILLTFSWRLPEPFFLLGFATVIPLAMMQGKIAQVHRAVGVDPDINRRFGWANIAGIVIGGPLLLLAFVGAFLPAA